jgi:outer membrane cobalamin receptor
MRQIWAGIVLLCCLGLPVCVFAQTNSGELRLKVTDSDGLAVKSTVELISEVNQLHKTLETDEQGTLTAKLLPFGLYRVEIQHEGFAPFTQSWEVRSAVPAEFHVTLSIAPLSMAVVVQDVGDTLIDPHRAGTINRVGSEEIESRAASSPGRSLQDLVNSQPGWLYEGNAVLHPRGFEYQTQFVVDGIPLTDNRSPSFGPEIEADDVQSMSIYTAGIPAEYGRKLGGVIEVNTTRDTRQGLHGEADISGESFDTADASGALQFGWGKNTVSLSAGGNRTDRYLNAPVLQNYTNRGTTGEFSGSYERDITDNDRLSVSVRHELSRFLVPNEQLQEAAGQRQDRNNFETMGVISYQHIFSANVLADFRGMVRDEAEGLSSNAVSTPIAAFQSNGFREGYFKSSLSVHHGHQEWKAGIESDATFLNERFSYQITDPSQFDPGTPLSFQFPVNGLGSVHGLDLEQSAFVQNMIRLGKWSVSAGLRWDHYQLLLNQNAVSPRLAIARYVPSADLVLHASYDRAFQTPDFENILLSSSPAVASLNPEVLRLPVQPSHGNYYEVGITKGFFKMVSLDANYYLRSLNNFADDDQLLDTAVSFPISFRKARIYGSEAKLSIPHWGRISGYVSYSYMVASAYLPVTGGLFLGDDASHALNNLNGRFWVSQDQRNTLRTGFRYQIVPRAWVAVGAQYGSGLPFEFTGTQSDAVAQFGQAIVNRVNFAAGRVRPSFSFDTTVGVELFRKDNLRVRLQGDIQNINNRLNLIDFAGLFSGNAIAPPRSYAIRLQTSF